MSMALGYRPVIAGAKHSKGVGGSQRASLPVFENIPDDFSATFLSFSIHRSALQQTATVSAEKSDIGLPWFYEGNPL
jgi:hypothetical protein